jgi:hypothetical protein
VADRANQRTAPTAFFGLEQRRDAEKKIVPFFRSFGAPNL